MKSIRLAGMVLIAGMAGCHTGPKPVEYSPRLYLHQNQPREVWLTLKDGSAVTMVGPRIIDDTLFGWTPGGNEDLTIAISDVKSLKARKLDVFRTSLIPAAFVGAGVSLFLLVHHPDNTAGEGQDVGSCGDGECDGM